MRPLLVVLVVAAAATDVAAAIAEPQAKRTRCVPPAYGGVWYRTHTLRTTFVRAGPPVGTAVFRRLRDCAAYPVPVHRIRRIAPTVAVALGGSSRRLLIRSGVCPPRDNGEAALLRCLRGVSG